MEQKGKFNHVSEELYMLKHIKWYRRKDGTHCIISQLFGADIWKSGGVFLGKIDIRYGTHKEKRFSTLSKAKKWAEQIYFEMLKSQLLRVYDKD